MAYPLPEELGRIVNGYAKPLFVYCRLFSQAKSVLVPIHWVPLQKALKGLDAEQVCAELEYYLLTIRTRKHCEYSIRTMALTEEEKTQWRTCLKESKIYEAAALKELLFQVYECGVW
jgi:hypothetical protein